MSRHIHIKPGIVINVIISSYSASSAYRYRMPLVRLRELILIHDGERHFLNQHLLFIEGLYILQVHIVDLIRDTIIAGGFPRDSKDEGSVLVYNASHHQVVHIRLEFVQHDKTILRLHSGLGQQRL